MLARADRDTCEKIGVNGGNSGIDSSDSDGSGNERSLGCKQPATRRDVRV